MLTVTTAQDRVRPIKTAYSFPSPEEEKPYEKVLLRLSSSPQKSVQQAKDLLQQTAKRLPTIPKGSKIDQEKLTSIIKKALRWKTLLGFQTKGPPKFSIIHEYFFDGLIYRRLRIIDSLLGSFQALLILPGESNLKTPAILGLHGHGGSPQGFAELLMGHRLGKEGYTVFLPRFRAMENRYEREFSRRLFLHGYHLLGLRVYEAYLCAQVLKNIPGVNPQRMGLLAHSGGSAVAHILTRLEPIFKACVSDYDSSYHLTWEEFCCEAVPQLALHAHQLNARDSFLSKALKVPYHFSPDEEKILSFYRENLAPQPSSFSKIQDQLKGKYQLTLGLEISRLKHQSPKTPGLKIIPAGGWRNQKLELGALEYPSLADPYLQQIADWEILTGRIEQAFESTRLQRLPENRLRALFRILPHLIDQKQDLLPTVLQAINEEMKRFKEKQHLIESLDHLQIPSSSGRALPMVLGILQKTLSQISTNEKFPQQTLQIYTNLLLNSNFSTTSLEALEQLPAAKRLDCLLSAAEQVLSPPIREDVFQIFFKAYQKESKVLTEYDLLKLSLHVRRSFPNHFSKLPTTLTRPIIKLNAKFSAQQWNTLIQEALKAGDLTLVKQILASIHQDERSDILYELTLLSLEKELFPNQVLSLFSKEIKKWKNPAMRAGMREEIVRESGMDTPTGFFRNWLNLAIEDVSLIKALFDRNKHAQNLMLLAGKLGYLEEARKFQKLIPWIQSSREMEEKLLALKEKASASNQSHPNDGISPALAFSRIQNLDKTRLEQAIPLLPFLDLSAQIRIYPNLLEMAQQGNGNKKIYLLMDLGYQLLKMGNRFESARVFRKLPSLILSFSMNDFDEVMRNCLNGFFILGLWEDYHTLLKDYLQRLLSEQDSQTAQKRWEEFTAHLSPDSPVSRSLLRSIQINP